MAESYLARAHRIQRSTLRDLGYLAGGSSCAEASFISYRRSDVEPQWSDLWYVATQLGADAALLRADPAFGRCTLDKTANFLECFADRPSGLVARLLPGRRGASGFLGRGTFDGSRFLGGDKYCDDHGHLGLTLLAAFEATADGRFLDLARAAADWLIQGGVWDDVFGGGFWWNNRRGDSPEGKPAQANGLAADLFCRLFGLTGVAEYRDWGVRTLDWLDATLWDDDAQLYRWSVAYAEPAQRRGQLLSTRFFNYDQGIAIEAKLAHRRYIGADPADLARARAIAARLEPVFWHAGEGGFNLEAGFEQVFAIYSAWLTPSLLALYQVDPDPRWLDLARRNADALLAALGDGDGVASRGYAVAGRWEIDHTRDTVANAGLQWALAMLHGAAAPTEGTDPRLQC
jgi:uncharacterized protein YyaL (SSP411 family)